MRKLSRSNSHEFEYNPDDDVKKKMAHENGWKRVNVKKFNGVFNALDKGWKLEANLTGEVVLYCVISGAPIHFPINFQINRVYQENLDVEIHNELELPEDFDDDVEILPQNLDLDELLVESILLETPDYPKLAKYLEDENWNYSTDDDFDGEEEKNNPFANLKSELEKKQQNR